MTSPILLTLNPGSSTLKLGLFAVEPNGPRRLGKGIIDLGRPPLVLRIIEGATSVDIPIRAPGTDDLHGVIAEVLDWLMQHFTVGAITGIGHRVVHGGDRFTGCALVTEAILNEIEALIPLAPLHQTQSVHLIKTIRHLRPDVPQTASFDTAFHRTQTDLVRRFALPRALFDQGIKRYGFHGLTYKFVAAQLRQVAPGISEGRIVIAHLGSGASLCGLHAGTSRDTSMSFSTLDGIPMATRCGTLDPGVLIHLVKERGMSIEAVEDMLYHRSGLFGVSGISADSRILIGIDESGAREALALFAFRISREIAAIVNTLGGLDGLVFTAGIGEHQPQVRQAVCNHLAWLGVKIDPAANARHATQIQASGSAVSVLVVPTDEEQVIADETFSVIRTAMPGTPTI